MLAYALKPFNSHFYNRVKYIIIIFKDLQDLAPAYLTCFLYHRAVLVLQLPTPLSILQKHCILSCLWSLIYTIPSGKRWVDFLPVGCSLILFLSDKFKHFSVQYYEAFNAS